MENITIKPVGRADIEKFYKEMGWNFPDNVKLTRVDPLYNFRIKNIIRNDKATIIFWKDGTKTVVKLQNNDTYDKETALVWAIAKKALGNKYDYYDVIKKWCKQ